MRDLLNRTHERWALLRRTDQQNERLALFVHGFRGSYLTTWGQLPDMLNRHADVQQPFASWDYLFVGYDTRCIDTYLDISRLVFSHWRLAESGDQPFINRYRRLALFGHSLGTLGLRQVLCAWADHTPGLVSAIHSVTLFGTPLNGSPLASFAFGYPIRRALKSKNPQLRMLKTWTTGAYPVRPWPLVSVVLGQDDQVVGDDYAELIQWAGDDAVHMTTLDHGGLVKPQEWHGSAATIYLARGLK
jgi:hypothetical protein